MTSCARVLEDYKGNDVDDEEIVLHRDDVVAISWAHSNDAWYWCSVAKGSPSEGAVKRMWIPKSLVKLVGPWGAGIYVATDAAQPLLHGARISLPAFEQFGDGDHRDGGGNEAPALEGKLSAFVYPLSEDEFKEQVFARHRVFVSHYPVERLLPLLEGLPCHDEAHRFVERAQSVVSIMQTPDGTAHHFDVTDTVVAKRILASGASLYITPDTSLDETHLKPLAQSLYGKWACQHLTVDGIGGDLEAFLTVSRGLTEWHFDGQSGFNVQLRGTKIWQLILDDQAVAAAAMCPNAFGNSSNSSNAVQRYRQKAAHRIYTPGKPLPGPVQKGSERVITVLMRPGSVLYCPRGAWHRVICNDNDGALSINFSFSAIPSYADLVVPALQSLLHKNASWREPVSGSFETVVQTMDSLLQHQRATASLFASLTAQTLLPPQMAAVAGESDDDDNEAGATVDVESFEPAVSPLCSFCVNPLAALVSPSIDDPLYEPDTDNYDVMGSLLASVIQHQQKNQQQCKSCSCWCTQVSNFCQNCGASLQKQDRPAAPHAQKQRDGHETWYCFVCPSDQKAMSTSVLELPVSLHDAMTALALGGGNLSVHSSQPVNTENHDLWQRLLAALLYTGFLIPDKQSTFDFDPK